jgi:hypothetical protein
MHILPDLKTACVVVGGLQAIGNPLQQIGREDAAFGFDGDKIIAGYCLHSF